MILDHIQNAALYYCLGPRLALALRALQKTDLLNAAPGCYELQGSDVFALAQRYDTKPRALGKWEAHRRNIDVQYVVAGAEVMGHAPARDMAPTDAYDEKKDILFLAGASGNFLTVSAGMFAIFTRTTPTCPRSPSPRLRRFGKSSSKSAPFERRRRTPRRRRKFLGRYTTTNLTA